ncbi:MAG: hypothetical protein JWO67_5950 [Streptosporangiaceae bacterium]|nr:hypothetical protein [Streptosporangiaceae bacterium]
MSRLTALGTYLPPWGTGSARQAGPDEDALTLGVAAARAALGSRPAVDVDRVVFVSHDLPLLEGGNGAALLAGIGLPLGVAVVEQIGGGPAALDALAGAAPGTLIIAADVAPAGAAAALVGDTGPQLSPAGRITRSLPVRSRARDGVVHDYEDPRLQRERGLGVAVEKLGLPEKPAVVAGVPAKQAAGMCAGRPAALPTTGASAALFALAALEQVGSPGLVLAVEQASATAVSVDGIPEVHRDERDPRPPQPVRQTPGPDIAVSLAAYERAFEPKLRWEAGRCDACGTLAFPPRYRCLGCGSEGGWSLVPLPRTGAVYTTVTVHIPVPALPTPYSLAIVELDGVDVRALVKVTGVPAGTTGIGDRGTLVLRRVAVRSGVPDYGYALLPDEPAAGETEGAAR